MRTSESGSYGDVSSKGFGLTLKSPPKTSWPSLNSVSLSKVASRKVSWVRSVYVSKGVYCLGYFHFQEDKPAQRIWKMAYRFKGAWFVASYGRTFCLGDRGGAQEGPWRSSGGTMEKLRNHWLNKWVGSLGVDWEVKCVSCRNNTWAPRLFNSNHSLPHFCGEQRPRTL